MTVQKFLDRAEVVSSRRTADGYLVAEVRCARAGSQLYLPQELGLRDSAGEPLSVYRPPEVVFAKDSLRTYAGKPVTLQHPPESVTADNWKTYAVGETGDEVVRDGDFVRVGIMVRDAEAIRAIEAGVREISMGYSTPIEYREGVAHDGQPFQAVQTGPILINHLALVDKARGGADLRIGDGAGSWGAVPIQQKKEGPMPDLRTVLVDGLSVETTDAGAKAIDTLQRKLSDSLSKLEAKSGEIADLKTAVETKDGEVTALKRKLEDAISPKVLADAAKKRAKVEKAGKDYGIDEDDMEEMTDADIRRAVVTKSLGADASKAMSDAAIEGAFVTLTSPKLMGDARLGAGLKIQDSDPWAPFTPKKEG